MISLRQAGTGKRYRDGAAEAPSRR